MRPAKASFFPYAPRRQTWATSQARSRSAAPMADKAEA